MFSALRSEFIKLKGSLQLYLVVGLMLLQLLIVLPYVLFLKNGIAVVDIAMLTFIGYPLVTSVSAVLLFEQERSANFFQEIRCYPQKYQLWGLKVFVSDLLLACALPSIWLIQGQLKLALVSLLLLLVLAHIHIGATFFVERTTNVLLGFVEALFIIFASNQALLNVHFLPVILPINYVFQPKSLYFSLALSYIFLALCIMIIGIRRLEKHHSK